jgi:hypothetical protein
MDLLGFLVAFGGGIFGASIGALNAFVFVGFLVIAAVAAQAGSGELLAYPFGPAFGPHVGGFASGVAAAAFAQKKGIPGVNGKDIVAPMMGLNDPSVLLVGGAFGILGYVINWIYGLVGFPFTDSVALTVVTSAIIVRLIWGNGIFGKVPAGISRWSPPAEMQWVPWQSGLTQRLVIGLGVGLFSSFLAIKIGAENGGGAIGFGIAAASLVLLSMGLKIPVTHHIALPAAVAALASGSIIWGAVFGVLGAVLGEIMANLFNVYGDTHIDPPAATIATLTSFSLLLAALGVYGIAALP